MSLKVGDKLFYVSGSNDRNRTFDIEIVKVGNKYLTCKILPHSMEFKITKDTLREVTNVGSPGKAYYHRETWELEIRANKLFDELRQKIGYGRTQASSPDAIKEAARLLGINIGE